MSPPTRERRPVEGPTSQQLIAASEASLAEQPTETQPDGAVVDLAQCDRRTFDLVLSGHASGYGAGLERGWELADLHAETLTRNAAATVHTMAELDPWPEATIKRLERYGVSAERVRRECAEASP